MEVIFEPKIKTHNPALYEADFDAVVHKGWDDVDSTALKQYDKEGYLIIEAAFESSVIKRAQKELKEMTYADDPKCASIYYEGAIREHLNTEIQEVENKGNEKSTEGLALGNSRKELPELDASLRSRYVRKFMGFTDKHEPLNKLATNSQLLSLICSLCGDNSIELFQEMAMIKPPGGREKPWHQDHAYFNHPLGTKIIGVWIALSKVTPSNGCMYLLPGIQNQGPIPHFMRRDWQICDDDIYEKLADRRISAPMKPGDVLIFDSKLPHGTPKNISDNYRWAVQLHYRTVSSESCSNEDRLLNFGSEGKNVSC